MKLPEKQQLIILGAAAVVIAGFVVFRYVPVARRGRAVKLSQADQQALVANANARSSRLPILRAKAEQLRQQTAGYDVQIPQRRNFAGLWQQIADVMNRHNLKDQLVQPNTEIKGEQLNCIQITIKCSGTLNQIFELFKSLEQFERLIQIERLQLAGDKNFYGLIKMDATANVYYRDTTNQSS